MPSSLIIRRANGSDVHDLCGLARQTFIESHGHSASHVDISAYVAKAFELAIVRRELSDSSNHFYLAYDKEVLVGYSKCILDTAHPAVSTVGITKLERIYVLAQYHDRQIGAELLQHSIKYAQAQSQSGMWLNVWVENHRAVRFYERFGFGIIGSYDFQISERHSNPNHQMYLGW